MDCAECYQPIFLTRDQPGTWFVDWQGHHFNDIPGSICGKNRQDCGSRMNSWVSRGAIIPVVALALFFP